MYEFDRINDTQQLAGLLMLIGFIMWWPALVKVLQGDSQYAGLMWAGLWITGIGFVIAVWEWLARWHCGMP